MPTEPSSTADALPHLGAMADAYRTQLQDPAIGTLNFDERVALLIEAEHLSRQHPQARPSAQGGQAPDSECVSRGFGLRASPRTRSVADPTTRHRPLDCRTSQRPHHGRHRRWEDVRRLRAGATRLSARVPHDSTRRLPRFFQELALARADGSDSTLLARFARVDVLVIDDWGLAALSDVQRQDLLGHGGSRRDPLDDHHESAAPRSMARVSGRADDRRRGL